MTKLLEQVVEAAQNVPPEMQDEIARIMLLYVGNEPETAELAAADEAAVLRSREVAALGEFATDEPVKALWAQYEL